MNRILIVATLCSTVAVPLAAQQGCPDGSLPITDLGFKFGHLLTAASYSINRATGEAVITDAQGVVTVTGPGGGTTEPRILSVTENGISADKVKQGDVIARVNGYPVTTAEGSSALYTAKPGAALVLTVRRDDKLIPVTITPRTAYCPARVRSSAPGVASGAMVSRAPTEVQPLARGGGGGAVAQARPAPAGASTRAMAGELVLDRVQSPGWLGMGFDCANCGQRQTAKGRIWYFNEPPRIYNVDSGSPAHVAGLRRDDVLLRVDGNAVTTETAGLRLAQVKPGETLKLSYKRGVRIADATIKVAPSPARASLTLEKAAAQEALRSTQELRASTKMTDVSDLMSQVARSKSIQDARMKELEVNISKARITSPEIRASLEKLSRAQDEAASVQQNMLQELRRSMEQRSETLATVEQQLQRATTTSGRMNTVTVDTAYGRPLSLREQRLRWSGSIANAEVEVRGPGSVSVQRDGNDLIIITGDSVIRITGRSQGARMPD